MEYKKKMDALEPVTFPIGQLGEMLTLPAIMVWTLANILKESLLDRYELVPSVPTPDNQHPTPYFRLKEEDNEPTD